MTAMKTLTQVLCLALLGCGGTDASNQALPEGDTQAVTMAESICADRGGLHSTQGHSDDSTVAATALAFSCIDGTVGRVPVPRRVAGAR